MPDYVQETRRAARAAGIDPNLFVRQIRQESGFNPSARSPAGALGIAQIMPATARGWGVDPTDPVASLHAAARAMRHYVDQFGSYRDALVAYNAGPGTVGHALPAETQHYVSSILSGKTPRAPQGSDSSGGLAGALTGSVTPGSSTGTEFDPGAPTDQGLASLLSSQPPAQQATVTPPAPSTRSYLRMSVQSPVVAPPPPSSGGGGLDNLLSELQSQELPSVSTTGATASVSGALAPSSGSSGSPVGTSRGGLAHFDGKPVAAWIKPVLQYARAHGWQGTVQSGYRTDAEQKAIYDRGTRPAAVPISEGGQGSNHERTGFLQGAIDVTDASTLNRILRAKHSRLQWAGQRDPVHFSVPRGGSY